MSVVFFAAVLVLLRDFRLLQRYQYTIGAAGLLLDSAAPQGSATPPGSFRSPW